jgi:CheY-like chemotaxis protein
MEQQPLEVLLVEDEVFIVLDIEDALLERGMVVAASFSTNAPVLEWLQKHRPSLAIIDYQLRDDTSTAVARALAMLQIPTVVYSGNSFKECLHQEVFGRFQWVDKPGNLTGLMAAIETVLHRDSNG